MPIEELLANRDWLRALARSLVRDEHMAADLEQETWRSALERPPHRSGSPRAWLATVLRNRARDEHRRGTRRHAREQRAARPERERPTSELAEQADTQRRVIRSVLKLDEPYRSTILLCYFEGLHSQQIAERMDTTASTVRTRLSRAHERLRTELQEAYGGKSKLRAALLPIAGPGRGAPAPGVPVALAGMRVATTGWLVPLLGVAFAALVGVLVWQPWDEGDPQSAPRLRSESADAVARAELEGMLERPGPATGGAEEAHGDEFEGKPDAAAKDQSRDSTERPAARPSRLVALIVDADGTPVAGADVILVDRSDAKHLVKGTLVGRTKSGADGHATFEGFQPKGNLQARAAHDGAAAISGVFDGMAPPTTPVRLQLGPTTLLAGRVVDADGAGVSGAVVVLFAEVPGSVEAIAVRRTGEAGEFRIEGVPTSLLRLGQKQAAALEVRAKAFVETLLSLGPDVRDPERLEVVLARAREVSGRVVDVQGVPIPDVSLEFPDSNGGSDTDAQGRFRAGGLPPRDVTILFRSREHAPRQIIVPFEEMSTTRIDDVVLVAGHPISGVVVDADGKPLTNVHVAVSSEAVDQIVRQGGVDVQGRFRFEHLGDGLHEIHVFTTEGGEATHTGVRAGDERIRVVVRPGPHVIVTFADAAGGKSLGVEAVTLLARLSDDPETSTGASHGGEDLRRLRLDLPRAGRYDVTVCVSGYKPFEQKGVVVDADSGPVVEARLIPLPLTR